MMRTFFIKFDWGARGGGAAFLGASREGGGGGIFSSGPGACHPLTGPDYTLRWG